MLLRRIAAGAATGLVVVGLAGCGGQSATSATHSSAGAKAAAKQFITDEFITDAVARKNAKVLEREMTANATLDARTPGAAFYGDPLGSALGVVLAGDLRYLKTAHMRVNVHGNWASVWVPMTSLAGSGESVTQLVQAQVKKDGGMILRFAYEHGHWLFNDAV